MNKRKLILSCCLANVFEWYDYALFGHFAPLIATKFFPNSDPSTSILQAFLVFAAGYLIRPVGGVFFGIVGDKFGRRVALSSAMFCMAFPTALIVIVPTYATIGISATILMVMVRLIQGVSVGGALTGSISFAIEHSLQKHRGFTGSLSMAGICLGILLGSIVSFVVKSLLSEEQFNEWGWRLPFLIGIFILFAGIYVKKYTTETPLFEELRDNKKIVTSPLRHVVLRHWSSMLISILINATGSVIFYFQAIYLITFLKMNRGFSDTEVSILLNICYFIMAIATILTAIVSDIIGRVKTFAIILAIIICSCSLLLRIFETGSFYEIIFAQIFLSILAACYIGPEPALQAELYPTNIRNTALSLSYNLATSIFGGTTPYIIELIVQKTGKITSCTYYIIACAVLSLIGLYFYKSRAKNFP
jgi:MFS transporter, MHS family, proline/betaine transporter